MQNEHYETEQERFWAGEFGDAYIERNRRPELLAAKTAVFAKILSHAGAVTSVLELGANIGLNLLALRSLRPRPGFERSKSITKQPASCNVSSGCRPTRLPSSSSSRRRRPIWCSRLAC